MAQQKVVYTELRRLHKMRETDLTADSDATGNLEGGPEMNIKITAELQAPKEVRPAVGSVCEVVRTEIMPNGRTMHFISAGITQIGVLPEECEVVRQ